MAANNRKSKLVEEQINKLLAVERHDSEKYPNYSPMVKKMIENEPHEKNVHKLKQILEVERHESGNDPNYSQMVKKMIENEPLEKNVHKLKQIFEEKFSPAKSLSPDNGSRAKKKKISPQSRVLSKALRLNSFDCIRRMASSPTKQHVNRLERLVRELLQKERDYIDTLEKGIYNYVRPVAMKTFDKFEVPNEIRNQKFKLFGNIEEICLLHKSTVLPRLLSCGDNIYQISETLINLIQSDAFYCYIDYAINHKQAEQLLSSHANFFASLQKTCNDRLGVLSFIIQPIQKIPRYPLILEEMIKELSKDMHMNKKALASLCIAKKNIEKFLARLNQALTINDIIETHEVNTSLQCGLITCLQIEFGVNINEPTLLIVPSFTSNHGYRQSLNVYKLGKFITTEHLDVSENLNAPKAFPCKIFLFEQCLLYTKVINHNGQNLLSYRDHFTFGSNFVMSLKRTQQMLIVGDIISNRYVSFTASDYEAVLELYDFVKSLYHPRYSNDSLKSLEYPRYSSDSAFAEGNEMNLEVPNIDEDEIVVNESMADNDWVVTDIDMIRESCVDDDISDEVDFWVPRQFLKSFGMCKTQGKKKVLETSNSRFYVESPETTFN